VPPRKLALFKGVILIPRVVLAVTGPRGRATTQTRPAADHLLEIAANRQHLPESSLIGFR
jgi:hypothetical protein